MDRRQLLKSLAAGAAMSAMPVGAAFADTEAGSTAFRAFLDQLAKDFILQDPTSLTALGMDRGELAGARFKLSDQSKAHSDRMAQKLRTAMADLRGIDPEGLTRVEKTWLEWIIFYAETNSKGDEFDYGVGGYPSPYRISQLTGLYQFIPDFMRTQHRIEAADDAEAYLARLEDFAVQLDVECERTREEIGLGVVAPDFILQKTLDQLNSLMAGAPADHSLVTSLAKRTADKGLGGDWAARAEGIMASKVLPALKRQAELMQATLPLSNHDAGVWKQPRGDEFYAYGLQVYTSTTMTPDEIHQVGLEQVADYTARADTLLRGLGMTQGSVGQRIAALSDLEGQIYPNTDEGKARLIADLNTDIAHMDTLLPAYFGRLPKSPVEVRRIPAEIEAGAPGGYYMSPALDGSRPGAFYINLRDTAEVPKFSLRTLTWHEASPGHHFQLALSMEQQDLPMVMKFVGFSANSEGWGLYAEQLAKEMGVYENDPLGELGYLQSMLFRSARLVVDTGMHAKRWSREQAIRYMVDVLGDQESNVTTEVERYCVWTGQACAYKVGHNVWADLRTETQSRLGAGFDVRAYHDYGLALGQVPLAVLQREIRAWNG